MRIRWRNFQLDSWHPARVFLFLNLVTATLTVLSAGVVSAHRPIGPYWLGILVATLIGGLFFAIPLRTLRVGYRVGAVTAISMGAVLYRFWPAISSRAAITTSEDVSNYVAFAQYLFRYVRGTAGNLPPIDQYISYFSNTRFATASVLSVFSFVLQWRFRARPRSIDRFAPDKCFRRVHSAGASTKLFNPDVLARRNLRFVVRLDSEHDLSREPR